MITITGIGGLRELQGQVLGHSEYLEVTQPQVDTFAEATGDRQWIHTDPQRATTESPFGGPIAHGYLTLSLAPALLPQIMTVEGFRMGVNYGCNKVRFPAPVLVGSKLRLSALLKSVEDIHAGVQLTLTLTFEVEGADKPACVAEVIYRYYD